MTASAADMDAMQTAVLQDPAVQAAVQQAGKDALNDPKVQEMMIKTAKEKFPQYADVAVAKASQWAKDPEVQAKAHHYAGVAGHAAMAAVGRSGEITLGLVEQGPTGVRVLAFAASVASCVNAVMFCLGVGNLLSVVAYVVCAYQLIFAISSLIFEAPPSVMEKIPGITKYQDMLIDKAKFVSEVLGRGLFYIFQGSLWLAFANITKILDLAVGGSLVFVGVLHIAMHFGKLGTVASKMRSGYERLPQGAAGSP